ncbi:hypothetical protein [Deinococcus peraridilitoris]|uniref:hypothetical protein n=1 Tax=Deinococcus peraridilitoris TaxID=432329 RepID=UPI0012FB0E08|nr:hypothetical protein [Deinococcus peraridilitoris]
MNEQIKEAVREQMFRKRLNQSEVARQLNLTPQALSKTLRRGEMPETWGRLLELLDLELIAVPKERQQ